MERKELMNKISEIIEEINSETYDNFSEDDNLVDDLKLDSINLVSMQVMIEDEFDIRFNPIEDDLSHVFETIGSLLHYIEVKLDE